MSPLGSAIVEVIRVALDRLGDVSPGEADRIVATLVTDLRSRRPMAVAPLSLWDPTEPPPSSPPGQAE